MGLEGNDLGLRRKRETVGSNKQLRQPGVFNESCIGTIPRQPTALAIGDMSAFRCKLQSRDDFSSFGKTCEHWESREEAHLFFAEIFIEYLSVLCWVLGYGK